MARDRDQHGHRASIGLMTARDELYCVKDAVELETSRDDLLGAHRRVLGRVSGLLVCDRYRREAKRKGRRAHVFVRALIATAVVLFMRSKAKVEPGSYATFASPAVRMLGWFCVR